jgi:hypothetical protein
MTADEGRRWRELRARFAAFPPDDQERLLGQMERLLALAQDRDMGAFLEWVDTLLSSLSGMSRATRRPPSQKYVEMGHAKASSHDPASPPETLSWSLLRPGPARLALGGAAAQRRVTPGRPR